MARTVGIGYQDFGDIIENDYFYIDKTIFIKEWWESGDSVTLITRPRRFGKTLTMSMLDYFFSIAHEDKAYLFEGLSIWEEKKYHDIQGKYPVIDLTFSAIKGTDFRDTIYRISQIFADLYSRYTFILDTDVLLDEEKTYFRKIIAATEGTDVSMAVFRLSSFLYKFYGKKVIILLDEYDTPMQEAYLNGYRDELTGFTRNMFNSTFKANPYLERAIITGITRRMK